MPNSNSDQVWEKVLWRRHKHPDNYTDASFMQHLVVNAHVPVRSYWRIVFGSVAIAQQLSTVVAASATPLHLAKGHVNAVVVLAICAALLVTGYGLCLLLGGHLLGGSLRRGLRQCFFLVGGVFFMSPLLRSLTRTVSEDSIIAITVLCFTVHLFLHDYNFVNILTDKLTGTVSLGAAVFGSVLIASCMPSDLDVFAHVLLSLELFLLWPLTRRYIHQASAAAHVLLALVMVAVSALITAPLSVLAMWVFLAGVSFTCFICPAWLVRIHKFKAKINGPWDEADPKISMSIKQTAEG